MKPIPHQPGGGMFGAAAAATLLAAALVCFWVSEAAALGFAAAAVAAFCVGAARAFWPVRRYFGPMLAPVSRGLLNAASSALYWVVFMPLAALTRGRRARATWNNPRSHGASYWVKAKTK